MRNKVVPLLIAAIVVVLSISAPIAQQAAPQTAPQTAPPTPQGPRLDPDAIKALRDMGTYLRSLNAFQVEAVTSTEDVLSDGQKVQFGGVINMVARMPDRLRVSITSDRRDRLFLYDGKQFTVVARRSNQYATVPAPPTIRQLADAIDEKYDVEMPLEDLFRWGGPESHDQAITAAMLVGPSEIGGVTCAHYAFRQDGLDWQVWIQRGAYPLPRKLVLTTTTDEARPQYTATFTWNLAPSFDDGAFAFTPPAGASRIVLAER